MARDNFTAHVGNLTSRGNFIADRADWLKKFEKLDPAAIVPEIKEVSATDARQERQKRAKIEGTEGKDEAVDAAMTVVSPVLDDLRGGIKRAQRKKLLAALPKTSTAHSFDEKVGILKSVLAFIKENADVATGVKPEELTKIETAVGKLEAAQKAAQAARLAVPATTQDLEGRVQRTSHRVTAWLDILAGIAVLTDDVEGEQAVAEMRAAHRRDHAAAQEPGTPGTPGTTTPPAPPHA